VSFCMGATSRNSSMISSENRFTFFGISSVLSRFDSTNRYRKTIRDGG